MLLEKNHEQEINEYTEDLHRNAETVQMLTF